MSFCPRDRSLIDALIDAALEPEDRARLEEHMADCARCRSEAEGIRAVRALVGASAVDRPPPPSLVLRVRSALAEAREKESTNGVRPVRRAWLAAAAALLVVGAIAVGVSYRLRDERQSATGSRMVTELIDDHIRYLASPAPMEVTASRPDEVARFFEGKLTCSVTPPQTEARLLGARLCYVLDRRVALLFYDRVPGRSSVFLMPDHDGALARAASRWPGSCHEGRAGFRLCVWDHGGMVLAAVGEDESALRAAFGPRSDEHPGMRRRGAKEAP